MDADQWDRQSLAAALPVAVVAAIAAIISYGHIETLALAVHQPIADARLLPFAVDFLIVAGSVILLAGYWLGWLCVVAGVSATLFANIESGLPHGALAAAVAAWPAVAFTVASFVLERWLLRHRVPGAEIMQMQNDHEVSDLEPGAEIKEIFKDHEVSDLEPGAERVPASVSDALPHLTGEAAPDEAAPDEAAPDEAAPAASANGHSADAHRVQHECSGDAVPSLREIQRILGCGQTRAKRVQTEVREMRALAGCIG